MNKIIAIIKSVRPKHWVKNGFVFAALVFAGKFTDLRSIALSFSAFFLFSFAASSVYLINDVCDYEADKKHPKKKFRPIPSGDLSRTLAVIIAALLIIGTISTSLLINPKLSLVLGLYFANNFLYSFFFKHKVVIDVLMISFGFVLRAVGGAYAIDVPNSEWFLVITFLLTVFLALMKRRQEFVEIEKNGGEKRKVLDNYSVELLDQMSNIVLPSVLVSYIIYTFNTFHTRYFIFSIPLVLYGLFRYLFLVHKRDMGESPTATLLKDLPLLLSVVTWAILSMILIYFFE